jgi:hypothetical protein
MMHPAPKLRVLYAIAPALAAIAAVTGRFMLVHPLIVLIVYLLSIAATIRTLFLFGDVTAWRVVSVCLSLVFLKVGFFPAFDYATLLTSGLLS